MCFFRKKRDAEKIAANKELIEDNAKSMDSLIVLAEHAENDGLVKDMKELREQLKYLIATGNEKVKEFDKKIKNVIGDLKIVLVKADGESNEKAGKLLLQLKLLIADRKALL